MIKLNNLRCDICWEYMANIIKQKSGGDIVYFIPAAGNYGDALINIGSRQFFDFFKIEYSELSRKSMLEGKFVGTDFSRLLVLGGGGAYCRNFSSTHMLVKKLYEYKAENIVVLPSTYDLPEIGAGEVQYFSRDKFNSQTRIEGSVFCHDMALFIDLEFEGPELANRIWRLYAMRADREGHSYNELFESNFDVSRVGDASYTNPVPFFQLISNFKEVVTDRMHVAIAASMMGLRCKLLRGNYFKSQDVFMSSLEPFYKKTSLASIDELR